MELGFGLFGAYSYRHFQQFLTYFLTTSHYGENSLDCFFFKIDWWISHSWVDVWKP